MDTTVLEEENFLDSVKPRKVVILKKHATKRKIPIQSPTPAEQDELRRMASTGNLLLKTHQFFTAQQYQRGSPQIYNQAELLLKQSKTSTITHSLDNHCYGEAQRLLSSEKERLK